MFLDFEGAQFVDSEQKTWSPDAQLHFRARTLSIAVKGLVYVSLQPGLCTLLRDDLTSGASAWTAPRVCQAHSGEYLLPLDLS